MNLTPFRAGKERLVFLTWRQRTYPHVTTVLSQRCSKSGDGHRINGDVVEDEDRYERQSQQEPRETVQCANLSLRYICIVELRTHGYPGTVSLQCAASSTPSVKSHRYLSKMTTIRMIVLLLLMVACACGQEICCQYDHEKLSGVSAMACSSYSCASTIKDWGSPTHKTSTDSCSSCQLITKSDQKDNTDTAKPAVTAVTDDNWVQCCLYSSPPNYTDPLIAYAQDQASECPKKQQGATMIGTWWATNKDDCFFTMSTYEPYGAVVSNSTALG